MRAYLIELSFAFQAYGLSLVLASYLHGYHGWTGVPVSLVPMPSTLLVAWVILRNLRKMDEREKRIQGEAIGMAFVITALVTFNYGFLESAGFPRQSAFWVWGIMGASWFFAQFITKRRYA